MSNAFFITGAGTGVGKTLAACALAAQLRAAGRNLRALKPVASGFDESMPHLSDSGALLAAQGIVLTPQTLDDTTPWRFTAPLSPDMAAEEEARSLDWESLLAFCRDSDAEDITLIEGIGGAMTPLDPARTVLDWMQALHLPVIMVTGSYLGSLSHCLTACEAVVKRGLKLHAVIVSASEAAPVEPARAASTLARFLPPGTRLLCIPRIDAAESPWNFAPDLTAALQ